MTRVVQEWGMDRTRVASLSKWIGPLFDGGDERAKEILDRAAKELALTAITLKRRLGLADGAPVGYSGGVFSLGERIIKPFGKALSEAGLCLTHPLYSPDLGALILAFQGAGALLPPSFEKQLLE